MVTNWTYDKLELSAYDNIFEVIDTRTNVADPKDSNGNRKFVYDHAPEVKGSDFGGYPCIFVNMPVIEHDEQSVDGTMRFVSGTIEIITRASIFGTNNFDSSVGRKDILNIGSDLIKTFNSSSVKQQLRTAGMYKVVLNKTTQDTLDIDQEPIFEGIYKLTFEARKKVVD